jgi:hypothetical protein
MIWVTGKPRAEWREGYTQLIRAPGDPDEKATRGYDGERQKRWGIAPHRRIKALHPDQLAADILVALGDKEMTFNAISVKAFDLTADVVYLTMINAVLWDLVEDEVLEHTLEAPILFRRTRKNHAHTNSQ